MFIMFVFVYVYMGLIFYVYILVIMFQSEHAWVSIYSITYNKKYFKKKKDFFLPLKIGSFSSRLSNFAQFFRLCNLNFQSLCINENSWKMFENKSILFKTIQVILNNFKWF